MLLPMIPYAWWCVLLPLVAAAKFMTAFLCEDTEYIVFLQELNLLYGHTTRQMFHHPSKINIGDLAQMC